MYTFTFQVPRPDAKFYIPRQESKELIDLEDDLNWVDQTFLVNKEGHNNHACKRTGIS